MRRWVAPAVVAALKDVNIFVWTEYIPQEAIDCFEEYMASMSIATNTQVMRSSTPRSAPAATAMI